MQGKRLQYLAANKLIQTLITAMIMGDGDEDEEEEFVDAGDAPDEHSQEQTQNNQENNQESISGGSQPRAQVRRDFSNVCRFYKNGKCKFGKECRKEHPEMCKKFRKHGLVKHNPGGCDGKCGKLHPNACRESLRSKECSRAECRFFHIKGTKNTNTQEEKKKESATTRQEKAQPDNQRNEIVFLQAQMEMMDAIKDLRTQMEEMRKWTQPHPVAQLRPKGWTGSTPQQ